MRQLNHHVNRSGDSYAHADRSGAVVSESKVTIARMQERGMGRLSNQPPRRHYTTMSSSVCLSACLPLRRHMVLSVHPSELDELKQKKGVPKSVSGYFDMLLIVDQTRTHLLLYIVVYTGAFVSYTDTINRSTRVVQESPTVVVQ